MALHASDLQKMTMSELDELFSCSPAGAIPYGRGNGRVLLGDDTPLTNPVASTIHTLFWKGKVVDREKGTLRNLILPIGLPAVIAKVYQAKSWFDTGECTVLDYSRTSILAHYIRDEIREVAPGLYLGIVYWGKHKTIDFSLDFPGARK